MPPSAYNSRLAKNLVKARDESGFDRKSLGLLLARTSKHFTPVYNILSRIDAAERPIRPIELWEMAKAMGVKPESLLPERQPARAIRATMTVEQVASLAPLVGMPADELLSLVAASVAKK
jgi:hypothetical protein